MASTKKDTAHIYFFYNPCQPSPVGEIKVNTIGFGHFGGVLSGFDGDFLLFPSLPIPAWTPPSPLQIPAVVLFSTRALGVLFLWHVPTAQESRVNRCPVWHCELLPCPVCHCELLPEEVVPTNVRTFKCFIMLCETTRSTVILQCIEAFVVHVNSQIQLELIVRKCYRIKWWSR